VREIVPEAADASPVCYARETSDLYAGYATREELLAFLNELLEAERAIVRKLREILPRIRDDAMHADFSGMLKSHDENIARTNAELVPRASVTQT
jgi:hypothetical protein